MFLVSSKNFKKNFLTCSLEKRLDGIHETWQEFDERMEELNQTAQNDFVEMNNSFNNMFEKIKMRCNTKSESIQTNLERTTSTFAWQQVRCNVYISIITSLQNSLGDIHENVTKFEHKLQRKWQL